MDVLILNEKHGTRVIEDSDEKVLELIRERREYDYYNWDEGDTTTQYADRADEILQREDAEAARDFLRERDSFEYEGFERQTV